MQAAARSLVEQAKQRYDRGFSERDAGELERSLDALSLAHTLWPDPSLLFNRAWVERQLGRCEDAASHYRQFLSASPSEPSRARATQELEGLAACVQAEGSAASFVAPAVSPVLLWHQAALAVTGARPLAWVELEDVSPAASSSEPVAERALLWGLIAGSGASAGLATAFFIQASSLHGDAKRLRRNPAAARTHSAQYRERLVERGEAAQTRARVFAGLASGLGLGAAVTLWLTREGPSTEPELRRQAFELQLHPGGGQLSGHWVF